MFERILVPLDGSRFGSRALKYAKEIAKHFNSEMILLQVVKPAIPVPVTSGLTQGSESPVTAEIAIEAARAEDKKNTTRAKQYLSRQTRDLKSQNIEVSYKMIPGEPADSIMAFARKQKIDLIVMSSHGKGGLKRAIMGSVADVVIREAGKPVLVVRPKNKK